jgi:hypothetical protein
MSRFQLAQLNLATVRAPLDSPIMADFVANLDRINALAEQSPGFAWRLMDDAGNATAFNPLGDDVIINLSVWDDVASLNDYVYKSAHVEIMKRRKEWFHRMEIAFVLWWVPRGHRPDIAEAVGRYEHLKAHGPHEQAFTFRRAFAPPDAHPGVAAPQFGNVCPA